MLVLYNIEYTKERITMNIPLIDLKAQYECDSSALRPETDVAPVEPKEKSGLEIFEQNIDNNIKHYIDLDDIANGKELWEPYDANWWNK